MKKLILVILFLFGTVLYGQGIPQYQVIGLVDSVAALRSDITSGASGAGYISDADWGSYWNGITDSTGSKNVLYDKIVTLAPLASPTFTGTVTAPDLSVTDDLTVGDTLFASNDIIVTDDVVVGDDISLANGSFINWGTDVGLYRSSPNYLRTNDLFSSNIVRLMRVLPVHQHFHLRQIPIMECIFQVLTI